MSQKYSAIDIGSNALRIIVAEWSPEKSIHQLEILKKWRAPVRLGQDVFQSEVISEETLQKATKAFLKFKKINEKYLVQHCRVVATSALREAKNKSHFIDSIFKSTGFKIELIDGREEGLLIHSAVQREVLMEKKSTMLIDVGGGSVEITFSEDGKVDSTQSFPMGTVRTLDLMKRKNLPESQLEKVIDDYKPELSQFINQSGFQGHLDFAIGTGGNIECLGELKIQLLKKIPNTYITMNEIEEIILHLRKYSIKDRIKKLNLREDRADVILPATMVVLEILKSASCFKLLIPRVGLRDGILWSAIEKSN